MSSFPRDLLRSLPPLHRYSQKPPEAVAETEEGKEKEAGEGIELSLGLSLNGRFGVDPRTARKSLGRSSSIPDFLSQPPPEMEFSPPLIRTCSLPAETEDECRKRKDIQNLRRLEAKRKRSQKQSACSIHGNPAEEGQGLGGIHLRRRPLSQQGSLGSHGSGTGSSGVSSESDIQQQFHAAESELASQALRGPPVANGSIPSDNQGLASGGGVGTTRNVLEEMPLVFTEGDGPDGKRVEGFLYRYRKGEEVRIVCVCHGSFFSPTEFVKHAGGDDVEHPMKQIVVLPSSLL